MIRTSSIWAWTSRTVPIVRAREDYAITQSGISLSLPLYTSQPIRTPDARITRAVIIVHGQSRNADDYFDYAAEAITGTPGMFLAAPMFATVDDSPAPGQLYWSSGWSQLDRSKAEAGPWRISSGAVLDDIIATIRASFPNVREVVIAGFSAGGQTVTRYAATNADSRNVYLVGGPSSYLYMSNQRFGPRAPGDNEYKYGLDNMSGTSYVSNIGAAALRSNFEAARVTTLVGDLDNDPNQEALDVRPEAMAQGANRVERMTFYRAHLCHTFGESIHVRHTFGLVPGAAHAGRLVLNSPAARAILRGQ